MNNTLIIGASSAIAQAVATQLKQENSNNYVVCISSKEFPTSPTSLPADLQWWRFDYNQASIEAVIHELKQQGQRFNQVFIFNGQLHNNELEPEKKLEDLNLDNLKPLFECNTLIPAFWISRLPSLLSKDSSKIVVLSARVGSISDNKLGGWYGYRASKAALNMFVKTTAIELQRKNKNATIIAFHPGTTDSPLSKPFQKRLPEGQLRQPADVAEGLLALCDTLTPQNTGAFYDWRAEHIPW